MAVKRTQHVSIGSWSEKLFFLSLTGLRVVSQSTDCMLAC